MLLWLAWSQSLDVATRLSPWPPPGWPEGAQGEVRLVAQAEGENNDIGIAFPIGEAGEVTYRFPETLPRRANSFYAPIDLAEFTICPEASPTLSPPDVEVATLVFEIYADGEVWGAIDMSLDQQEMFSYSGETFAAIFYARAPLRLGGGGVCPGVTDIDVPSEVVYDMNLQEGPNVAVMAYEASLSGSTAMTLTTRDTLELPGTPVKYSQ